VKTELGHGSNVRGLELEARWDPKTKEFILHSPTLTASKWWNGTLGRTANHAIVIAQLLLPEIESSGNQNYTSYGPHPFIVQIRHIKTHQPLDGIIIGDIGPKYGYASMDNGYMLFNNFRIPHSAFLSRNVQVDPETGKYSKPDHAGALYSTMTYVRANLIMHARLALARVATVAIRYTAIRRQFRDRDGRGNGPEMAVLDYPTVQIRVLPLLATAFALHYGGYAMWDLYSRTRESVEGGDYSHLADMHSTSAGLKSLCTGLAADGIEIGRRALGGHGFGAGSGLLQLNSEYHSQVTVEGDNYMITQQLASYLIKKATAIVESPDESSKDDTERILRDFYIARRYQDKGDKYDVLNNNKAILDAFQRRAAVLVRTS
jgi:acyl-CoA oxidase